MFAMLRHHFRLLMGWIAGRAERLDAKVAEGAGRFAKERGRLREQWGRVLGRGCVASCGFWEEVLHTSGAEVHLYEKEDLRACLEMRNARRFSDELA